MPMFAYIEFIFLQKLSLNSKLVRRIFGFIMIQDRSVSPLLQVQHKDSSYLSTKLKFCFPLSVIFSLSHNSYLSKDSLNICLPVVKQCHAYLVKINSLSERQKAEMTKKTVRRGRTTRELDRDLGQGPGLTGQEGMALS